jgi:hypothetical protein
MMEMSDMQPRLKSHKNTTGNERDATLFVSRQRTAIAKF